MHDYESRKLYKVVSVLDTFRDWSLITWRGVTKREGGRGHVKCYRYEKGGWAETVASFTEHSETAMLKGGGGGTTSFGVVFVW